MPASGRACALLFAFSATLLAVWALANPDAGQAATTTVITVADAHVRADRPLRNYGTNRSLVVGHSPVHRAYLRFNLRGVRNVTRAVLRLYEKRGSSNPRIDVRAVRTESWKERTITFAKRPPVGGRVKGARPPSRSGWLSIDVTPAVDGGRMVSLALTSPSSHDIVLTSRETRRKPKLVVTAQPVPQGFALPPSPISPGSRPARNSLPVTGTPPVPVPDPPPPPPPPPMDEQPNFPIRAAFYYSWFPEAWTQNGTAPFTHFTPSLGFYGSADTAVITKHLSALGYGKVDAGISSWWGQGTNEDSRFPLLLAETVRAKSKLRWALYYEGETLNDPASTQIEGDLAYIKARYAAHPAYLRVEGKPVVFVHADPNDGCAMADRWKQANAGQGYYVVLEAFPGWQACSSQPDSWHGYAPDTASQHVTGNSYSVSPGSWKADEATPRLVRDTARWGQNVRDMVASGEPWQLITTFNGWGDGTAVESASEWSACANCPGVYLNFLSRDGAPPTPPGANDPVIAAAGDVACNPASSAFNGGLGTAASCRQQYTSDLLVDQNLAAVLMLGDTQYEDSVFSDFAASYDVSWGRVKSLTYPALGNHDYHTSGASGYFDYFNGAGNQTGRAGDRSQGYYSFDVGAWHLISLNSNCWAVGGCDAVSPQVAWLRADLAAHSNQCTLAFWHHPRFSAGTYSDDSSFEPLWQALYDQGAEIVLNAHDHNYQRYAPQSPTGAADPNGIREFVVGTGGKVHYSVNSGPVQNREVANGDTYGVLKLTLHPRSYDWRFEPEAGGNFTDTGSAACH
jgi:acid phosphatase type 7